MLDDTTVKGQLSHGLYNVKTFRDNHPALQRHPGQEERNSDHLLEAGAAIRCNNLHTLAWKIDQLLNDPARLASLRDNARRLARPHAAHDIVRKLQELAENHPAPYP